jgi:DNA-directed RNA polymerase specialized sigma subunit
MTATSVKLATPNMKKRRYKTYPPLTKEQQALVAEHKWIAGRLAYSAQCLTGGYTGLLTKEDLESVANFALCVAATKFDSLKEVKFSTFAWTFARGYIQHALRDHSRLVKTPRWVAKYKNKVDEMLRNKLSYGEISEVLGIPEEKVIIVEMTSYNYHVSYDSNPEDWVSREFIFNDDEVKPYIASPELIEAIRGMSESELATITKFIEGRDINQADKEWAASRFSDLHDIAHGFNEDPVD